MQTGRETQWKMIPGFPEIRCNDMGEFQSCAGRWNSWHDVKPYRRNGRPAYFVHARDESGKVREMKAARLVVIAFIGEIPKGYSVMHKNRLQSDNSIYNLALCSKKKLGEIAGGHAKRIPCAKVDRLGKVEKIYPSAREAAKHEHCSYQTIMDRCNWKVKKPYELFGGYTFIWMKA